MTTLHHLLRLPIGVAAVAFALTAPAAFAQTPTFTVVNHGLDATFGNAGKALGAPAVTGLQGVAYGAGLFVVIGNSTGEDGIRWATSPDGTTWTGRTQALTGGMKTYTQSRVRFLNGKFMFFAVHTTSSGGTTWCYTSADGLTWTANKVADGNHRFEEFDASPTLAVAAGSDGDQYASNDLVTWTARPVVPSGGLYSHNDVAFGNGRFFPASTASAVPPIPAPMRSPGRPSPPRPPPEAAASRPVTAWSSSATTPAVSVALMALRSPPIPPGPVPLR